MRLAALLLLTTATTEPDVFSDAARAWLDCMELAAVRYAKELDAPLPDIADVAQGACGDKMLATQIVLNERIGLEAARATIERTRLQMRNKLMWLAAETRVVTGKR